MSEQPNGGHDLPPPDSNKNADILPFKARGAEGIDPKELSPAECVSVYLHKWTSLEFANAPIAEVIHADTPIGGVSDALQERLQQVIRDSPLFDLYEEIRGADSTLLLLESKVRSSDGPEQKALLKLMDLRAAEVIEHPDDDLESQLAKIPLGDEDLWRTLVERLAKQE